MNERLPWIKWYSRDALGDPCLRLCSPAARGIWYDMLWLMDVSERRGYLVRSGGPYTDADLCRVLGVTMPELEAAKSELMGNGVASVDPSGVWYNRRMVRDEYRREAGSMAGRRGGGNPALKQSSAPPPPAPLPPENTDTRSQKPEARTPIKDTFIGRAKGGVELPFTGQAFSEAWEAWREHRRRLRKPMTDHAQRLTLAKLPKVEATAIAWINNAIERGWQGIFEPKTDGGRTPANRSKLVNTWHDPNPDQEMRRAF